VWGGLWGSERNVNDSRQSWLLHAAPGDALTHLFAERERDCADDYGVYKLGVAQAG